MTCPIHSTCKHKHFAKCPCYHKPILFPTHSLLVQETTPVNAELKRMMMQEHEIRKGLIEGWE